MKRIRVMQLVAGIAVGDQLGGAELFALQLARYLDQDAFEVKVCGLWQYGSPREREWLGQLQRDAIDTTLLVRPAGRLRHDLQVAFSRLWSVLNEFQPNVINSHSERTDVFNMLLHRLHPVRPHAVRTMQTDQQWQRRPWAGMVLSNFFYPIGFDLEVGTSQTICQTLDARPFARLLRKEAHLCYSGIDAKMLERTTPINASGLPGGVPTAKPRLGIIGRLSEQKGHTDLLDAMLIIRKTVPAELLIIGSGELEADLQQKTTRLGLADCVHFLGSRNDVFDIMPCLDVIVSSSWWEGFPTVLLEGMALGVPIVATDVSGSRELVTTDETGILVPPHDPARLAEAILWLLEDSSFAQTMARQARQRAERFTVQNAARKCAEIYQQIASH
jgi:glycosyltransferase involved in cell wall biosynthesis